MIVRFQLLPNIFVVRLPVGQLATGDLQFRNPQRAVTIRADPFDSRPAGRQHVAPGAGGDRHDQPAQATTAAAVIPNGDVEKTGPGKEHAENREREPHIVKEHGLSPESRGRRIGEKERDNGQKTVSQTGGDEQLECQVRPVPHRITYLY